MQHFYIIKFCNWTTVSLETDVQALRMIYNINFVRYNVTMNSAETFIRHHSITLQTAGLCFYTVGPRYKGRYYKAYVLIAWVTNEPSSWQNTHYKDVSLHFEPIFGQKRAVLLVMRIETLNLNIWQHYNKFPLFFITGIGIVLNVFVYPFVLLRCT